ncbi:hypothetical protein BGY98DRAFT_686107 [Russula aff. rugulosa BPL654]|nr:hypothetical protein BGY98DRAFT_686107 [Russula aff. rugulosa BPL654]
MVDHTAARSLLTVPAAAAAVDCAQGRTFRTVSRSVSSIRRGCAVVVLLLLGSSAAVSPCSDGPWSIIGALEPPTFPERRKALSLIRWCAGAVKQEFVAKLGMNGANVGYKKDDC